MAQLLDAVFLGVGKQQHLDCRATDRTYYADCAACQKMLIPEEPRESWAIYNARVFLWQAGVARLPVNPFGVAEKYKWALLTTKQASVLSATHHHALISGEDSDAYYCNGMYHIVYNERAHKPRIPYSIAHEIGHIVLGHLEQFEQTRLSRGGLGKQEYRVLEREADIFAAEMLMPLPVLRKVRPSSPAVIAQICGVSKSTAFLRFGELQRSFVHDDLDDDHWVQEQFDSYLKPIAFCSKLRKRPAIHFEIDSDEAIILKEQAHRAQTASLTKFAICPQCGNGQFFYYAKFCKMCGSVLIRTYPDAPDGFCEHGTWPVWHTTVNLGCLEYCEYCGSKILLTYMGLLVPPREIDAVLFGGIIDEVALTDEEGWEKLAKPE